MICTSVPDNWRGTIKSTFDGIERDTTLTIKQSLLSIAVKMDTNESTSNSISASIDKILDVWQLTYTYLNIPAANVRERSAIHYGTALLSLDNPQIIKGQYFTDRKTNGDICVKYIF